MLPPALALLHTTTPSPFSPPSSSQTEEGEDGEDGGEEWDPITHYAIHKLLERLLTSTSHRNSVLVSSLPEISKGVWGAWTRSRVSGAGGGAGGDSKGKEGGNGGGNAVQKEQRKVMQRLLRKLFEMGARTEEMRGVFREAVVVRAVAKPITAPPPPSAQNGNGDSTDSKPNGNDNSKSKGKAKEKATGENDGEKAEEEVEYEQTLDPDILELLRSSIKTRWPDHFSMEGSRAAVKFVEEGVRGLPVAGFTFMVRPFPLHSFPFPLPFALPARL